MTRRRPGDELTDTAVDVAIDQACRIRGLADDPGTGTPKSPPPRPRAGA